MITLKVGDKVVFEVSTRWSRDVGYKFSEVVRTTKTQAILSNGARLKINSSRYGKNNVFYEVGDYYYSWQLSTPEIVEKAKVEQKRKQVEIWFDTYKFTDEQKAAIYEMFKEMETVKEG
jgi:hypothetical protein